MALTVNQAIATQASLAYLGRPQDVGALTTFGLGLAAGAVPSPTAAQLKELFASAESKVVFGTTATMSSVISKSFELVGRTATAQNITDIVTWATSAKLDISQLPWEIMKIALSTESLLPQASQVAWARLAVAYQFAEDISANPTALQGLASSTTQQDAARAVISGVTSFATIATAYPSTGSGTAANFVSGASSTAGQTFTLTTGVDSALVGSAGTTSTTGNDTFNAPAGTFTSLDAINGGSGTDTLNWVTTGAVTAGPASARLTSIETINYTTDNAYTLDLATDSVFSGSGVTTFAGTNAGAFATVLTGAATTDLSATNLTAALAGSITVNGGKNVTVSGASLRASGEVGAAISVGATTAAAGAVTVTESFTSGNVTANSTATGGLIGVTGGTVINITQNIASTSAANTTVLTGSAAAVTVTGGAITATGNSSTTAVTVTQSATVAAVNSATIGRIGITAGAVDILDANRASATAAGTITTATITNAGAVTVNSGALTTLNIGGTLTTVDAGTLGALTTAANTTLALNLTGAVSAGAVTIDTDITTLNISGNTTASTINSLVTSATAINVSGNAKVTLTGLTDAALTAFTVTNTAGASSGTAALGTGVTFTGGAGADTVVIGATTKAITMGAGNDTVTATGLVGTGGSVGGGDGTDIIVMTDAQAAAADNSSTFNTKFTSFETLQISDAMVEDALDLDGINAVTKVVLAAGATTATIGNLVSGGTVQFNTTDSTGVTTINVKSALVGASDALNLVISNTGDVYAAAQITAANVETITITAADAASAGSAAAINTMTLVATSATSLTVSGNNGLTLTNTGNVAITNFDASGVVNNNTAASTFVAATTDTAANLAVTFVSANTTTTAAVSIRGGEGNDTLTGVAAIDTITGNGGNDIIQGGAGADVLTGGTGTDTVAYADVTAATDHSLTGIAGMVINLSASTVTAATIATAMATAAGPTAPVIGGGAGVAGSDSAAGTAAYLATSAATSVVGMVRDTLTTFESVTGSGLRDYIVSSGSAGTITGGAGADYMIAGAAVDTFVQTTTSSRASTVSTFAGANAAAGDSFVFGNGVDIISGFTAGAGGDIMDVGTAGAAITGIGVAKGAFTTNKTVFLSGAYVQSTGTFTVAADGTGADTLLVDTTGGAVDMDADGSAAVFILLGVNSGNLVAANFV